MSNFSHPFLLKEEFFQNTIILTPLLVWNITLKEIENYQKIMEGDSDE